MHTPAYLYTYLYTYLYAYLYGLATIAITETQEKLQVCENNWVRRIAGEKRIDKRRKEEMREEVGVKESLTRKQARRRPKWTGHVKRMEGVRLTKRADALGVEGRREWRVEGSGG